MPEIETSDFGTLHFDEKEVVRFESGLPAFDEERDFVLVERDHARPIVFLQSLSQPDLAFVTLPVLVIEPDYRPQLMAEDLEKIGFAADEQPELGSDILCLAIVTLSDPPTANLMAPVVVNLGNRRAVQAIQAGGPYSHQCPLPGPQEEKC